jgi:hypothetical protein
MNDKLTKRPSAWAILTIVLLTTNYSSADEHAHSQLWGENGERWSAPRGGRAAFKLFVCFQAVWQATTAVAKMFAQGTRRPPSSLVLLCVSVPPCEQVFFQSRGAAARCRTVDTAFTPLVQRGRPRPCCTSHQGTAHGAADSSNPR